MRRLTTWSASVVSSRASRLADSTASDTTGWSSGLKRETIGSLTSRLKAALTSATFSRTSCAASTGSVTRSNSMITTDRPSYERDDSLLMPLTVLTCSSILRVMSLSMISGDAPGYSVWTTTTGKLTSGN